MNKIASLILLILSTMFLLAVLNDGNVKTLPIETVDKREPIKITKSLVKGNSEGEIIIILEDGTRCILINAGKPNEELRCKYEVN